MSKTIPGPNPNPRRPNLKLPPKSCDSHCHVFGPQDKFPYFEGRSYTPPDATIEQYADLLELLGIERSVIVQPSIYGTDNSCTEDGIRRLNGNGRGVAVIDPDISLAELERMNGAGFRGARFNLYHAGGSTPFDQLENITAKIAEVEWHTQVYAQGPDLPDMLARLKALPTPLVIDHLGHMAQGEGLNQAGFKALLELLETGKCWVKLCAYRFDLSGAPYREAIPFVRALYQAAPERLVWGTDWPHPNVRSMPDDGGLRNTGCHTRSAACREKAAQHQGNKQCEAEE